MGVDTYFTRPCALRRLYEGPIGIQIDLFADRLLSEGHSQASATLHLRVVADFSRWLAREKVGLSDLNEGIVERYLRCRSRHGKRTTGYHVVFRRLFAVLRDVGAIRPRPPEDLGPLDQIARDFERYSTQERGLANSTVTARKLALRQFLRDQHIARLESLSNLTAAEIGRFIDRYVQTHSRNLAEAMCTTLRSFLQYLRYRGEISVELSGSLPHARKWRFTSLPSYLEPREIERVLATCNRRSPVGRRDYAILQVLSRIGLRANEVRLLTLDDIDWESGQLTVRGKGGRDAVMPLPKDVGAAIVDYLRHGRPISDSRRLFLRDHAPRDGFVTSGAVTCVAKLALRRAGIEGFARKGAHLFRHSLATTMLRAGASLREIGQILRHQNQDTTRIYAKVDLHALRGLAFPWPGGVR